MMVDWRWRPVARNTALDVDWKHTVLGKSMWRGSNRASTPNVGRSAQAREVVTWPCEEGCDPAEEGAERERQQGRDRTRRGVAVRVSCLT